MIEDVKIVVNYLVPTMEPHNPPKTSNIEQNATPFSVPPIKVEVSGGVIDLGNPELNDVAKEINQINIDFSSMKITKVYTIHSVVIVEIKLRKRTLTKQVKAANKNIKKMKLVVHETEQKTKAWEENCQKNRQGISFVL